MHELALADAVVKAALCAADDAGIVQLERILVSVGELQQIETDLFEYSLTTVMPAHDPRLAGVRFDIREEAVRFRCRPCSTEFDRTDAPVTDEDAGEAMHFIPELSHAYVRCPSCGSPDFEIIAGRGVTVQRIEGAGPDDPA